MFVKMQRMLQSLRAFLLVAILFAFLMMITAIGSGNMPQINNIALVMNTEFAVPKLFTGL